MRLKVLIALIVAIGLVLVALTAFAAYRFFFAPKRDDAVTFVPESSVFYASAFLEPSTPQKRAIQSLLAKTPLENFDAAAEKFRNLFDQGLQDTDCSFKEDFEPWLGDQIASFFQAPDGPAASPDGGVLIATEDEDASIEAWTKCSDPTTDFNDSKTYKDVDYRVSDTGQVVTAFDGFLVATTEDGFKASVDARNGDSLQDSSKYQDATDDLTEDHLASLYLDLKALTEGLMDAPGFVAPGFGAFPGLTGGALDRPITATVFAQPNGLVLEYASGIPKEGPLASLPSELVNSEVLPTLPDDSWGALGIGDLGNYIQDILDSLDAAPFAGINQESIEEQIRNATGLDLQNDILSWMGDVGLFVRGTNLFSIDGGVVIGTTDRDKAQAAVAVLGQFLATQGAPVQNKELDGGRGFTISDPTLPQPIDFVVGDDTVVIAYGDDAATAALSSVDRLGDSEDFKTAVAGVGDGYSLTGYFDVPAIVELGESIGTTDADYQEDVKPILDSVRYVALGSKVTDDTSLTRLVLGVE